MKATISFELIDKKIGSEEVAGLAALSFDPEDLEMGRRALQLVESTASPKLVVGFCDPDDIGFFIECDWINGGVYNGKVLVASGSISEEDFDGNIW